jgi:hypothetical protein
MVRRGWWLFMMLFGMHSYLLRKDVTFCVLHEQTHDFFFGHLSFNFCVNKFTLWFWLMDDVQMLVDVIIIIDLTWVFFQQNNRFWAFDIIKKLSTKLGLGQCFFFLANYCQNSTFLKRPATTITKGKIRRKLLVFPWEGVSPQFFFYWLQFEESSLK